MAKGTKPEIEVARQLYLYGAGDGKRVISTKGLVEATGLHPETIANHLPKWEKQAEEILINSNSVGLGLELSAKDLQLHKDCMNTLAEQLKQIEWEMDKISDIAADLRQWAKETSDPEESFQMLDRYLRSMGSKATLRSQFLAYQKQFATLSGVIDLKDISVTAAKEMSKGRAKLKLKSEENGDPPKNAGSNLTGVFARPQNAPRPA